MTAKKLLWCLWIIFLIPIVTSCSVTVDIDRQTDYINLIGDLEVYFFYVGQGDSTLFKGQDFNILIDAGNHENNDVVPYLKTLGITDIDLLIATHPHTDHIGQMAKVIKEFSVGEIWMSGNTSSTSTFENLIDILNSNDISYYEPKTGEEFQISSMEIKVLNPSSLTGDLNNDSISLILQYGEVKFLFTGDAESRSEHEIINRDFNISADIFHAGHHGSSTSNTSAFLNAINPEVVIYSAGIDNPYGHPHDEVIERLNNMGIDVYGTDVYGTIKVITDGIQFAIDTSYGD